MHSTNEADIQRLGDYIKAKTHIHQSHHCPPSHRHCLRLAQCKKLLYVNSGNPCATEFIFLTSLGQPLLNSFSHVWSIPNTFIFLKQVMFFPVSPGLLSKGMISLQTWQHQLIKPIRLPISSSPLPRPRGNSLPELLSQLPLFAPFVISITHHGIQNRIWTGQRPIAVEMGILN